MLEDVLRHAREDVKKVDDPAGQALNETTAEVLGGLAKATSTMRPLGRSLALTRHSFWFRFNAPGLGARF